MLAFEQSQNEKLLEKKLKSYDREVCWNTELENIIQQEGRVEILIKYISQAGQPTEKLSARYVIACDGAKSIARHLLNFTFKGGTYEKQFYVADTKLKWASGFNKLVLCPGRKNFCGFFPMPGDNSHRIIGTIPKELDEKVDINFADMERSIKDTVKFPLEIEAMNWFSIYKLHHRAVDTFRKGNCFLAGDAAHIHSPAGGQGMNTGLQDAYNLSWKLAWVIKNNANEKLLDTYTEERLPFAHWLLKFTDRAFAAMTSSNILISWLRNNILPLFINLFFKKPAIRTAMFKAVSQIQWSYKDCSISQNMSSQKLRFHAGDRLPYILLNSSHNRKESIYTLLTEPVFHLLIIGNARQVTTSSEKIKTIGVNIDEWKPWGVTKPLYILLRPDNYIALIADELDEQKLHTYLRDYCCIN